MNRLQNVSCKQAQNATSTDWYRDVPRGKLWQIAACNVRLTGNPGILLSCCIFVTLGNPTKLTRRLQEVRQNSHIEGILGGSGIGETRW